MNQVYPYRRPCPACGRMVSYYENDMGHAWSSCARCGWNYDAIPVVEPDGRWRYKVSDNRPALAGLHNLSLPGVERGEPGKGGSNDKARPNLAARLLEWMKKWTK